MWLYHIVSIDLSMLSILFHTIHLKITVGCQGRRRQSQMLRWKSPNEELDPKDAMIAGISWHPAWFQQFNIFEGIFMDILYGYIWLHMATIYGSASIIMHLWGQTKCFHEFPRQFLCFLSVGKFKPIHPIVERICKQYATNDWARGRKFLWTWRKSIDFGDHHSSVCQHPSRGTRRWQRPISQETSRQL